MPKGWRIAVYGAVACAVIAPGLWRSGGGVPGSARSDLWNSLWSLWHGPWGLGHTLWLNHPEGGSLLIADPLNAVLLAPLVGLLGAATAWTLGVLFHLVLAMGAADLLAGELGASDDGCLVGGLAFGTTPLLLSSIHNGTSEAVSLGLMPLALWALLRLLARPDLRRGALAVLCLVLAAVAGPYIAVTTWIGAALLVLRGPRRGWAVLALALATMAYLPWAAFVHSLATASDNLVGIKQPHELALVRRTIGGADPLAFIVPGDFRSPDFRAISRYGEDFIHSTYIGWAWLIAAGVGLRRSRRWEWGVAALVGAILALGPVWVHGGSAVLFADDRGLPLPYILLEWVPGLGSLSLVYRLASLTALGVAMLAALSVRSKRVGRGLAVVGMFEILLLSPLGGGPDAAPLPELAPLEALSHAQPGGVMNYPVEGGRPYLYEATVHGMPVAGALNFPENGATRELWRALRKASPRDFEAQAARVGQRVGIRYLVVHRGGSAETGPHRDVVERIERTMQPLAKGQTMAVYPLW